MAGKVEKSFEVAGKNVRLVFKLIGHGAKREMLDYFGKYGISRESGALSDIDIPIGLLQNIVLRRAIDSLEVGGRPVKFESLYVAEDLPSIGLGEEDDDVDLYEEILNLIVREPGNRWLGRKYPYMIVFGQFLATEGEEEEEDEDGEDPLEETDTPTVMQFSGSNLKEAESQSQST